MASNTHGFKLTKGIKRLIIWGSLGLAFIIALASLYGFVNTVNTEGVKQENALVAQYKDNQNELSSYILSFKESLGIADRQTDKLNEILEDAVKGRYDNDTSLQPGTGGAMFSAIAEAYPDLTATTETYAKVQDLIVSGRDAYKNKQTKLLSMISTYDTWRNTGLVKRAVVSAMGFPGENLRVTDAGQTYTGLEALDRIRNIVLTQDAVDAYESGTQDALILPTE